jgi:ABC-type arginine transport system permease subunit
LVLYYGFLYQEYLQNLARTNYNPYPVFIFNFVFPIIFGILVASPILIKNFRNKGKLIIDKYRLIFAGIPTLYIVMMPLLYFTPLSQFFPLSYEIQRFYILPFGAGVVFGYVLITSFNKSDDN